MSGTATLRSNESRTIRRVFGRTGQLQPSREILEITKRPGDRIRTTTPVANEEVPQSTKVVASFNEEPTSNLKTYGMAALLFGTIVIIRKTLKKRKKAKK